MHTYKKRRILIIVFLSSITFFSCKKKGTIVFYSDLEDTQFGLSIYDENNEYKGEISTPTNVGSCVSESSTRYLVVEVPDDEKAYTFEVDGVFGTKTETVFFIGNETNSCKPHEID